VRGRESEQLGALFDAATLDVLAGYEGVRLEDDHAEMTLGIAGTSAPELEAACRSALWLLSRVAKWPAQVPPPRSMSGAIDAWRAFAERTGGRLETGSLSVQDCHLGVDRFSVATHWARADEPLATVVTFPFEPALEHEPSEGDPSLSSEARDLLKALAGAATNLETTRESLTWRTEGATQDPSTLLPTIEIAAALVRALRGRSTAGPFR
jgi:hypothetical protein